MYTCARIEPSILSSLEGIRPAAALSVHYLCTSRLIPFSWWVEWVGVVGGRWWDFSSTRPTFWLFLFFLLLRLIRLSRWHSCLRHVPIVLVYLRSHLKIYLWRPATTIKGGRCCLCSCGFVLVCLFSGGSLFLLFFLIFQWKGGNCFCSIHCLQF